MSAISGHSELARYYRRDCGVTAKNLRGPSSSLLKTLSRHRSAFCARRASLAHSIPIAIARCNATVTTRLLLKLRTTLAMWRAIQNIPANSHAIEIATQFLIADFGNWPSGSPRTPTHFIGSAHRARSRIFRFEAAAVNIDGVHRPCQGIWRTPDHRSDDDWRNRRLHPAPI
jgi:hypothetical protein